MKVFSRITIILIFVLAGILFLHNITSINADIGRHIKLGEIIWQTKEVPKTNLFSYTAQDFPFVNHHWLSEVIFYGIFSIGSGWLSGLQLIIIFKALVLLTAYFILYLIVRRHNIFAVALSFLISIFVFSARTEPRPEIFSYLIFAFYLFIIYKNKSIQNWKFSPLWLLPILQLLWVNLHIYFVLGPIIFLFFLVSRGFNFSGLRFWTWNLFRVSSLEFRVFIALILANFANPNLIRGAIYPFTVLNEYGYSVAENSSLFFLARYFGQWAPQDKLFLASVFILVGSFVVWFWKEKAPVDKRLVMSFVHRVGERLFDLLLVAMTITLSFKMQRNIPLFALGLFPIMTENLSEILNFKFSVFNQISKINFQKISIFLTILVLVSSIYFITSGKLYDYLDSSKTFGIKVSSAAQDGTNFVKENKIQGPMFNNFDIGSYLVWQLYPEQQVFIDGRPEAYPVEFFEKVYKPMQRDKKVWRETVEKYDINYVFFAHTDMTEWGGEFLERISKDPKWPMVFLNDAVVIFLKDTDENEIVINKYKFTADNMDARSDEIIRTLDKKDDNAFINYGNALFRFKWLEDSARVFESLIANQPDNPYGYQGAAYAYATMNDLATQEKAARNFEKAIGFGFKTFNNYFTLGIINANLGKFFDAEQNILEALEINPNNQNAKQVLEVIKNKQGLKNSFPQ